MCFLHINHKYGTLRNAKIFLTRVRGKRKNNGWDEPSLGILDAYMEIAQQNRSVKLL
jgi:hypothetical protein